MAEYVVAQAAVLIVPSLKGFEKELEAKLQAIQKAQDSLKIKIEGDTKKLVADYAAAKGWIESQEIEINAKVDTRYLTEIRHKYEDLAREVKKGLLLNLKVSGMSLLPQLASGLAAANASMVELARTAVGLPGLLAGVGSSFATILTGVSGVKNAFKEYSDAQKNAAQTGLQARNAALNVQNAYRDLGRSIRDARRNLEDLNAQMRDAPLDEAEAIIRLQEAQAEAADKLGKSGLQQQKDTLALLKAENALADTRTRNSRLLEDVATANAKGVAGADSVREATDRLSKATDDAATKQTKLSDSLRQLSPNAQSFVQAVTGMQSQWTALRMSVQDRMFDGLAAELGSLAQADLPLLQRGLEGIAGSINGNLKTAMATLQTEGNKGFAERIFGNTANAQGELDNALRPFIDGLMRLSAVGSDFLPRLAQGLSDVTDRFNTFIAQADQDGSLKKWIDGGLDALTSLGNSLINVGSMLNSLSEAFTDSGGTTFIETLEQASKRMADLLKSSEGQERLKAFFREARAELAQWKPILDQLPSIMKNAAEAGQQWANLLMPFLRTAAQLLGEHPLLVQTIFSAYMAWNGIAPILKGVWKGIDLLNTGISSYKSAVDDAGGRTNLFKDKIGKLTQALGPGFLITAVTGVVTWIGTNLVAAHDEAAAAAQRQKQDLDNLRSSLDDVTGAATRATNAMVAKNLRQGMNEATGQSYGDLTKYVSDPNALVQKIVSGDLQGALGMVSGAADAKAIEGTDFWKNEGERLRSKGVTSQIVADAVNGDPDAKAKYEKAQVEVMRDKAGPGFGNASVETLTGLERTRFPFGSAGRTPNLADFQGALPEDIRNRSALRGEIYSNTTGIQQQQADIRQDNQVGSGKYKLKDGSPFAGLGVLTDPTVGANGGGLTVRSEPGKDSALAQQLSQDGISFKPIPSGGFTVTIPEGSIDKYFQKYASGGMISGPGNGTSDSILARLSHGEFVVNAKATQQHLPLLEQINGGMPGFAGGGLNWLIRSPAPKAPAPTPPPPPSPKPAASSFLDVVKKPGAFASGNTISVGGTKPIQTKGSIGFSAGSLPPSASVGSDNPWIIDKLKQGATAVGKGLGVVPGYNQTSMGKTTISTKNSAWDTMMNPPIPSTDHNTVKGTSGIGTGIYKLPPSWASAGGSSPALSPSPSPAPKPTSGGGSTAPVTGPASPSPTPSAPAAPLPVTHGTGGSPGVGNGIPHITGGTPGPVSGVAFTPTALPPGFVPTPVAVTTMPDVTQEVNWGAGEAAKYGLSLTSGRRNEPGSFHNIGQAGDYSNQKSYGPPTPEMTAFANEVLAKYAPYIDELIYAGVSQNVYRGKLVPAIDMEGSPYNTGQAGYHGDHVHIAWKPGALQQLQQAGLMPTMAGPQSLTDIVNSMISGGAGPTSPSNMAPANTPTGIKLPQFTFGGGGTGTGDAGSGISLEQIGQNYIKFVADSWSNIIENLVKNAGQIAVKFIGSFFGLDLSPILGIANAVMGDAGNVAKLFDPGSGGSSKDSNLPANATVDAILGDAMAQKLPPDAVDYMRQTANQAIANGEDPGAVAQQLQAAVQQARSQMTGGTKAAASYNPAGGAEQWRPVVQAALNQVAHKYGITNKKAWEDDIIGQINLESRGNPGVDNLNDSDGKGGTQQVFGLGQFHPDTFKAHNVMGGDIHDPVAQIYAMIDYLASPKYGVVPGGGVNWKGNGWRNGKGYADGGRIVGPGSGTSDSILARVSHGEYIVRASQAGKHLGLLEAINQGKLPGYAGGGIIPPIVPVPVTPTPPPAPPPPPVSAPSVPPPLETGQPGAPQPTNPMSPQVIPDATGPQVSDPNAVDPAQAGMDQAKGILDQVGSALGGLGGGGGAVGAEAPAGADPNGDPRAVMAQGPKDQNHNRVAVNGMIQGIAGAVGSGISTALSMAATGASVAGAAGAGESAGASAGLSGGAAALGVGASFAGGIANAIGGGIAGAVNILSSLGVGTVSPGGNSGTGGAYGTPLLPQQKQQQSGPSVVNNWGGVKTSNEEEFFKTQQRKELQNASPFLARR